MMRFCLAPQIFLPTNWENIIIFGFLVVYVDFDAVENLHLTWPCIDPPYILMLFCCSVISDSLGPYGLQHARLPCPSPSSEICSNRYSLSRWCHTTISSSVIPFSSCPQSFSASGSFPMSRLFSSGGYSIGASASASVLPMSIQSWFPLGLIGLILQSKGFSGVFSNITIQMHVLGSSLSGVLNLQIQPAESNWGPCSAVVFTVEKDLCLSGLKQLKHLLFKD